MVTALSSFVVFHSRSSGGCNKLILVRNGIRSVHSTRATICESVLWSVWLLVSKHTAFANAVTTTGIRKNGRTSSHSDDSFSALLSFSFVQAKVGFAYGLPPISRGSFWSTRGVRCNSVFGCRPNRKHIGVCCLIEGSLFHQQSCVVWFGKVEFRPCIEESFGSTAMLIRLFIHATNM